MQPPVFLIFIVSSMLVERSHLVQLISGKNPLRDNRIHKLLDQLQDQSLEPPRTLGEAGRANLQQHSNTSRDVAANPPSSKNTTAAVETGEEHVTAVVEESKTCRFEGSYQMGNIPYNYYLPLTCANCYLYTFPNNEMLTSCRSPFYLCDRRNQSIRYLAQADEDFKSPIYDSLENTDKRKWRDCCLAAKDCCDAMLCQPNTSDEAMCPRTWDGWKCWGDTEAGKVAISDCPSYILDMADNKLNPTGTARKQCNSDGNWYIRYDPVCNGVGNESTYTSNEYTDYDDCYMISIEEQILPYNVHMACYVISICFLFVAFLTYVCNRYLRTQELHRIHMNLFASFILYGVLVTPYYWYYIRDSTGINGPCRRIDKNNVECKLFKLFIDYFRICKYMWMFSEGYYLFMKMVATFTNNIFSRYFPAESNIWFYYVLGWVSPVIFVLLYGAVRWNTEEQDKRCWFTPSEYEWFISAPCLIALLVNFVMLIGIVIKIRGLRRVTDNDESNDV